LDSRRTWSEKEGSTFRGHSVNHGNCFSDGSGTWDALSYCVILTCLLVRVNQHFCLLSFLVMGFRCYFRPSAAHCLGLVFLLSSSCISTLPITHLGLWQLAAWGAFLGSDTDYARSLHALHDPQRADPVQQPTEKSTTRKRDGPYLFLLFFSFSNGVTA
jgi:hypothetical protein